MTAARLLTLVLLLVSPLAAQNPDFNRITPEAFSSMPVQLAPAPSQPRPERVFDKKFFVVMSGLGGAESLRFTTRKLVVEHEFAAGAPWVSSVPSNPHLIARDLALFSSEFLVAYQLKKPHPWLPGDRIIRKLWWVYPVAMTALHVKNAVGNIRTQGPGGCTSVECAMQMQ
ncbi:MAG: hypothetical protein WCA16_20350 [Candidatus Sulfotelmatobacter sp.]